MRHGLALLVAVLWMAISVVTCLGWLAPDGCSLHDVVLNPLACEESR